MPAWIHDRATRLRAKNPSMPEGQSWAIATQQAHTLGKSPKGYGTAEGRATAKAKYKTPKDDTKTAMLAGFTDELEKIAFGLGDAKKVLKVVKGKAIKPPLMDRPAGLDYGFIPTAGGLTREMKGHAAMTGVPHEAIMEMAAPMLDVSKSLGGHIVVPPRGDSTHFLKSFHDQQLAPLKGRMEEMRSLVPGLANTERASEAFGQIRKPQDRQLMDGVIKGHELAESRVRPALGMAHFGHRSPEVILQEQNAVATLPHDSPVRAAMTAMRAGKESDVLQGVGVDYGAQRYSRHARKHLTGMMGAPVHAAIKGQLAVGGLG